MARITCSKSNGWSRHAWSLLLWCTTVWTTNCAAYEMTHVDVSNTSYYQELANSGTVVVDQLHYGVLGRRQSDSNSSSSDSSTTTTLNTDTGLPSPFDTSLGSNFTDSTCPTYFSTFLSDSTFLSCLPMSLLLQNSMSFFQAARSPSLLRKTLDTSCSASLAVCSPLMSKFAEQLISQGNCQDDCQRQNPLVMQAYAGLQAYEPLYQATCLKDNATGAYWFSEAMDSDNADDSYPYYTAIGLQLPAGSEPSCTDGLKATMSIFAGYAVQQNQPLSNTYLSCASQVNSKCGSDFATTQIQSVSKVNKSFGTREGCSKGLLIASFLASVMLITSG